jgi:hypothetical protein
VIYIRPKQGLRVICPDTFKPLKPAGEWVSLLPYWKRRLARGEVEVIRPVREVKKDTSKKEDKSNKKDK